MSNNKDKIRSTVAKPRCHYCRQLLGDLGGGLRRSPTKDHIVPLSRGGIDRSWNIVRACADCNTRKGSDWPTHDCPICREAIRRHAEKGITRDCIPEGWVPPTKRGRSSYLSRHPAIEE